MLSKEEIRNKWIYHTPLKPLPECVDAAMDEYAAVWKEKAEGYEKALDKIIEEINCNYNPSANVLRNIATKALEQFKTLTHDPHPKG